MLASAIAQAALAARSLPVHDNLAAGVLRQCAAALRKALPAVLDANARDLARMDKDNPKYDRLQLTASRILSIASDMEAVAALPSPLGKVWSETLRPNGMRIRKISVPFGLIGFIYEARPNVTFDVFSLCLKSGNACLLKGGSDAEASNEVLAGIIRNVLTQQGIDPNVCTLLPATREATAELLNAVGLVDLVIPRGSAALIRYVHGNARVPVIETGAGICHTYFDKEGDRSKGQAIITNAKTRRVSVCNALDCLIIHRQRLDDLPFLCRDLPSHGVIIYADPDAHAALLPHYPPHLLCEATDSSFGTEFLDYKMSIRTVDDLDQALAHIARYSSKHSESIISEDPAILDRFRQAVDAACVYTNVSTAFTDGAQFGFGAEIGISTQKLHARGPMALPELTTYKYLIDGNGQTRP
ncbi:MAG: glutamate-5-semialdehyde dehydrogenase [Tannerellaceae bacterium]|nr:glutamate-5-semialdehyde dehydrogenase [Tannerellaceae bacterium]